MKECTDSEDAFLLFVVAKGQSDSLVIKFDIDLSGIHLCLYPVRMSRRAKRCA